MHVLTGTVIHQEAVQFTLTTDNSILTPWKKQKKKGSMVDGKAKKEKELMPYGFF